MKKIFSFLLVASFLMIATFQSPDTSAQVTRRLVVQSSNAVSDTITFDPIASHLSGIQATVKKKTGTVGGKIYLEGTIDGIGWSRFDSLTVADVPISTKVFPISHSTGTSYRGYRFICVPTGTQTSTVYATYLRRTDE